MSVTTTVSVRSDGRKYPEPPSGMQIYAAAGSVIGSSGGGHQTVVFDFNPSGDRIFQPYVSIDFMSVNGSVAIIGNVWVYQVVNNWERSIGLARTIDVLVPVVTESSVQLQAAKHDTINLGRVELGTNGQLRFRAAEVDTAVMDISISGFISDQEMIGRDVWRA